MQKKSYRIYSFCVSKEIWRNSRIRSENSVLNFDNIRSWNWFRWKEKYRRKWRKKKSCMRIKWFVLITISNRLMHQLVCVVACDWGGERTSKWIFVCGWLYSYRAPIYVWWFGNPGVNSIDSVLTLKIPFDNDPNMRIVRQTVSAIPSFKLCDKPNVHKPNVRQIW